MHVSVDVPDVAVLVRVMLVGLRLHVASGVDVLFPRFTVAVNPLLAVTVMMDVAWAPTRNVRRVGFAVTLKLCSSAVIVTGTMREAE